jgi:AcrR family transcriptional regulator
MDQKQHPLSGRRGQAARNDERILAAAREVFVADAEAPVSAVASRAGVGISALYRRYPSKEDLLRQLCRDGLRLYVEEAEAAVADDGDPWEAFTGFLRRIVAADVHSLTVRLAGTFTPSDDMFADARRSGELNDQLIARTQARGGLRADVRSEDLPLILEMVAAIRPGVFGDDERTTELRQRYLSLCLEGLRPNAVPLTGAPPTNAELGRRWTRRGTSGLTIEPTAGRPR